MDNATLLAVSDFSRGRLNGTLDAIEKSGTDLAKVLAWRPAPGRAHIGWQAMHCAATHDRYLHAAILNQPVSEEQIVKDFAGGSTPSDEKVPTLPAIREQLAKQYASLRQFIESATPETFATMHKLGNGGQRSIGESIMLLAWHEAHHQGQIHLTWNMYKAAHGIA